MGGTLRPARSAARMLSAGVSRLPGMLALGVMYMNDKFELPETELTVLESIRNLLKTWFLMWIILTFLGTVGLIVLCVEILLRG